MLYSFEMTENSRFVVVTGRFSIPLKRQYSKERGSDFGVQLTDAILKKPKVVKSQYGRTILKRFQRVVSV